MIYEVASSDWRIAHRTFQSSGKSMTGEELSGFQLPVTSDMYIAGGVCNTYFSTWTLVHGWSENHYCMKLAQLDLLA